jgi:catechol 2,3-dioxygenase-like lactoylglutathione lyase family enzyme
MDLRLSVIGLVVADMATTLAFYRRLGLDLPADADDQPHVEVQVAGLRLAFDTEEVIRSFDPHYRRPEGSQRMSLAFDCGSPAEVDAAFAELTGAGYEGALEPWDAAWGMRYAVVHDPDGTPVDLFALLPA